MTVAEQTLEYEQRMHRRRVVLVLALWGPIFFWMAHLASMAALVRYVGNNPERWWIFWVDTGLCAAATVVCLTVATLMILAYDTTSDEATPESNARFLGWQGVLAGLANLALILAEGSYVLFLPLHR
jgi:hypothetical protein